MNIVAEKWDEIIHKLKIEYGLSNVSFRTWIEPLEVYNVSDSTVYILVPLKSSVDYINQKYLLPFQVCIAEITGQEFEVKFITVDDSQNINVKNQDDTYKKNATQNSIFEQANLNPKYTFDTGIPQTIDWYLNNKEWWENIISGEYKNYFQNMYVDKGRVEE